MEHITKPALNYFREFLQLIAVQDARIELIIVTAEDKEEVKQTVEKIAPVNGQFNSSSEDVTFGVIFQP